MVNAEAASGNRPYPEAIIATSLQTSYCVMATIVPELNSGRPGPSDTRPSGWENIQESEDTSGLLLCECGRSNATPIVCGVPVSAPQHVGRSKTADRWRPSVRVGGEL